MVVPEIKPNRNQEDIKQREIESKKMRRMDPRNLIKTKEEMEMMNHGLIDVNNISITNKREIMNARNYVSRLKVISEMIYQQTVIYQWERTRGKWQTTSVEIYSRLSMISLVIDGPVTYGCKKRYDRASRVSLAANEGITEGEMKYKVEKRDVTSTRIIMKTMVVRTIRATEMMDHG